MNPTLEAEIAKLDLNEKLELARKLDAELSAQIEKLGLPSTLLTEDDPLLEAELERRYQHMVAHPEECLTLEEFKASFGDK